jgi:transposase-like protein
MSPAKLSEADKNEILQLYRQTEETTSTLSTRFGVSSSTISRFLKNQLTDKEYEDLIQQKRLARTPDRHKEEESRPQQLEIILDPPSLEIIDDPEETIVPTRRRYSRTNPKTAETGEYIPRTRRRRGSIDPEASIDSTLKPIPKVEQIKIETEPVTVPAPIPAIVVKRPIPKQEQIEAIEEVDEVDDMSMADIGEMFGEDLTEDDLDDDDFEDDDDDDDDFEDDDEALEMLAYGKGRDREDSLQVLPFDRANVPRTCYLVVDRMAELITRPLREFGDLGAIPNEDIQAKTLPIFDNHRVARRFSHRTQRVIKVPDAPRLLEKTSAHLQAKGITRLLLDGQVYKI